LEWAGLAAEATDLMVHLVLMQLLELQTQAAVVVVVVKMVVLLEPHLALAVQELLLLDMLVQQSKHQAVIQLLLAVDM
jgi:hypothetical protein